jgi:predicted phage terminase large subunit-like protein
MSSAERRSLQSWYESVAYTRLQPNGAIVLIQTRWHEDDLAGWLLREHAAEGWRVMCLPAVAETNDLLGRRESAALWPERFELDALERIRSAIGSAAWIAMYQQRPAPDEGGIFKRQWWRSYADQPPYRTAIFSVDTAFKTTQTSDYSVIQVWLSNPEGFYLAHTWRERVEFPELQKAVVELASHWRPDAVLIEDAASGQSLIQALQAETRLPVLPVKPLGDKVARASAVSPLIESGRVFLPAAGWLSDFMDEVSSSRPHRMMTRSMPYPRRSLIYVGRAGPRRTPRCCRRPRA